jgi:hypothetical protein
MPFDPSIDINAVREERRKAVQESLQTISVEELRKVAKAHEEEFADDPSRDEFLRLMDEQPRASFYSAAPQQDIVVYYCRDADFGVWVLIGSGMGPLDADSKRLMKEAIEGHLSGRKSGGKK